MSTLANITSLNLSLQTGGAALAVKAADEVAQQVIDNQSVIDETLEARDEALAAAAEAMEYSAQYIPGKNLFDKTTVVEGSYIVSSNGSFASAADWNRTDRIAVEASTQYTISGLPASSKAYRFEDANNVLLSFGDNSSASFTVTTPVECAFVIFTIKRNTDADTRDAIQVELGAIATTYEAYTLYARTIANNEIVADNVIKNGIRISTETLLTQSDSNVRVWVSDDLEQVYARTKLNTTKDLVQTFTYQGGNDLIQPRRVIIVDRDANDSSDTYNAGTYIGSTSDDLAPFQFEAHGASGSNHGLNLPYLNVASHDKTSDDLGSIWSDGTYQWYLIEITSATRLTFYSKKYAGGAGDLIQPVIAALTLTHVSGGTNTANILGTSKADPEVFPVIKTSSVKILLDDIEISTGGVYSGNVFKILNTKLVVDIRNITVQSPFATNDGDDFALMSTSFTVDKTGACMVDEVIDFRVASPYTIDYYSLIQPQRYAAVGLSLTKTLMYIPRTDSVSGFDLAATPTDVITPLGTTLTYTSANVPDPTKPPNRAVQIFTTSGDLKTYGFAYGFNPLNGNTKDATRQSQAEYWELRGSSAKSYPRAINDYDAGTQLWHGIFYRCTYDSTLNPDFTAVYHHPNGNGFLLYIDVHQTVSKKQVVLPDYLAGMSITVVDNKDITLHTSDVVPASGLSVSFDVADTYGYLVIKLS